MLLSMNDSMVLLLVCWIVNGVIMKIELVGVMFDMVIIIVLCMLSVCDSVCGVFFIVGVVCMVFVDFDIIVILFFCVYVVFF